VILDVSPSNKEIKLILSSEIFNELIELSKADRDKYLIEKGVKLKELAEFINRIDISQGRINDRYRDIEQLNSKIIDIVSSASMARKSIVGTTITLTSIFLFGSLIADNTLGYQKSLYMYVMVIVGIILLAIVIYSAYKLRGINMRLREVDDIKIKISELLKDATQIEAELREMGCEVKDAVTKIGSLP
jgi:hypothetical protein